jgi:FtsP/CotA-like multicopper oxidase with cupredoxin domain
MQLCNLTIQRPDMHTTPAQPRPGLTSRREFLGHVFRAAGTLAVGTSLLEVASAQQKVRAWNLVAKKHTVAFADGSSVPFWRYAAKGGETRGDLPFLAAPEGTLVAVSIRNAAPFAIQPELVGVSSGPLIPSRQTGHFAFTMPAPGTYLFAQSHHGNVTSSLGIGAMVVSRPVGAPKQLYPGGPAFDREYDLVYQDCDDTWNNQVAAGQSPPTATYAPNYFTTNGLTYPDLAADAHSRIVGNVGERILIRFGNMGMMRQSIHFHGYHVEVAARNNQPEAFLGPKDTIPVPHRETVDVILTPDKPGVFPLHPHSLTAVTANGLYPYGQLTLMDIS